MSDYPDPDEEYELMYADELEMLQEDHNDLNIVRTKALPAKRTLDFSSPVPKKPINEVTEEFTPLPISQTSLPGSQTNSTSLNTNKRTAEELFGDIGDIDFDEIQLPTKKQKTEEESDLELIGKIIEERKLRQMRMEPSNRVQNQRKPMYDYKNNMSLNIPRWAFIPLTNANGDRIYVKLESEENWERSLEATLDQKSLHISYTKTWEEARKILENKQEQISQELSQPLPVMDTDVNGNNLWVEKYKPKSYLDLLSEEPVNRALLHWLHLWDKVVFKKEVKTLEPQQRSSFSKRTGQFQMSNKWKGKVECEGELDEGGRPLRRVALLCGPPGVGKTTLAHLLARIAGYRPVELNASDERSTEAFRTALQSATLMRSVIDTEKRPNCLILDEIDGAPLPTVELLVKWCTATEETGKKKTKSQPLKRPVIAICNDLYATSLRPLRAVSLIVQVGGVSLSRLSTRLSAVARLEGVCACARVCEALAARTHGDVRAAIMLLSLAKAKAKLTMDDVENAAIGTKDSNKSLLQALIAVFTTNDKQPESILRIVQGAGEYDRLADGIFENYLSGRVDARLLVAGETLSWLRLYDVINGWTARTQNYSLYGALPMCLAQCHRLLATRNPQRVKFPTQAQEMYRKKQELDSIVTSVWRECGARVSRSRRALWLDVLPLLPPLLAPALRSANLQLCSESERKAISTCAGAMCDYGLRYTQQRTPEGLYAFVLEPDIYKAAFLGSEERGRPPPMIRQAIAREQQLEIIRRNEEMAKRVWNSKPNSKEDKSSKETQLPNHLQRLKPMEVKKKSPQVHKDFFGRIVPITQSQRLDTSDDIISSSSVFYQYREGFNNAVRRNVRTKDLL